MKNSGERFCTESVAVHIPWLSPILAPLALYLSRIPRSRLIYVRPLAEFKEMS